MEIQLMGPKGAGAELFNFPVFWGRKSEFFPPFDGLAIISPRAPKYRLCLGPDLLWLSFTTSW